mgnify:CR=1 FL=1
MPKDNIRDFIDSWQAYDKEHNVTNAIWANRFKDAGYYHVQFMGGGQKWNEMHKWCKEHIGDRHYAWAGDNFWFETPEQSFWYRLAWG